MDDYSRLSPEDQRRLTDEMTRAFTSRPAPQPEPAPIVQPPPTPGIASGGILTEVEYERAEFTTAPGGVDIVRHALYRNPSGAEARGLLAPATRPFSVRPAPVVAPDTAHEAAGSPLSDDRGQTASGSHLTTWARHRAFWRLPTCCATWRCWASSSGARRYGSSRWR